MLILGITSGSESGAALFKDQQPYLAVSEERLSRTKLDARYPHAAIDWCLQEAGVTPGDIDMICYGFSAGVYDVDVLRSVMDAAALSSDAAGAVIRERILREYEIDHYQRKLFYAETRKRCPATPIFNCAHHEAHQAGAAAPSGFSEALVITADGRGDFKSLTISEFRNGALRELFALPSWQSLGYFYGRMTHLCGFRANRHEGKVTGLAAYGDAAAAQALVQKILPWAEVDGETVLTPAYGDYYRPFFSNYSQRLQDAARAYRREDLAAAAQQHLEEVICALVARYVVRTGLRQVCLAGGVFANIKLNQRIRALADVEEVFVDPAMSDAGLCMGAVYRYLLQQGQAVPALQTQYLGPQLDNGRLAAMLRAQGFQVGDAGRDYGAIIERLRKQAVLGLVGGRAEFGPRALGNRSVLAAAADPAIKERINELLGRDSFMPLGPMIAEELAERCLLDYTPRCRSARFMTLSFAVSDEFAANSPAAVHVDGTTRPQVVRREDHPFVHDLLLRWHAATGGLCLLNTSFNAHEEPIVTSADDVIVALRAGVVDGLLAPPFWCVADRQAMIA